MGDWIWIMIPLTALLIPIVAVLTSHQQKMASIIHSGQAANSQDRAEIEALRREIQALKEIVHQQAISMDTLIDRQTKLNAPKPEGIAERLSSS